METAIDALDAMDAADEDREDDETEIHCEDEGVVDALSWGMRHG